MFCLAPLCVPCGEGTLALYCLRSHCTRDGELSLASGSSDSAVLSACRWFICNSSYLLKNKQALTMCLVRQALKPQVRLWLIPQFVGINLLQQRETDLVAIKGLYSMQRGISVRNELIPSSVSPPKFSHSTGKHRLVQMTFVRVALKCRDA